jgi:hypothetical protein
MGEAFGYILQYQYDTNSQLVYAMMRKRGILGMLSIPYETYKTMMDTVEKQGKSINLLTEDQYSQVQREVQAAMKLVMDVMDVLGPEVAKLCPVDENDACDEQAILTFLQRRTLVGLIPLPKPISIRKFRMSGEIATWLTSFLYGVIYLHSGVPPIWYGTDVKLFTVKSASTSANASGEFQ